MSGGFSFSRCLAVGRKEFVQMRRDRVTFLMMVGIPMMQLVLFGFAINSDPRHLPTAIRSADNSIFSRNLVWALRNSGYFDVRREARTEREIRDWLDRGEVQFVVSIPSNFGRDLLRGDRPAVLVEADATDPAAAGNALGALTSIVDRAVARDLHGPLARLAATDPPVETIVHRHYNPEIDTQDNIVPGLLGVVLTMTMVVITALAVTRERERGTMENLLATPARPLEVIVGKIVPYILVGYLQALLILAAARLIFAVPMEGSVPLLLGLMLLFIAANLSVGITFSTLASNQLQAMQMSFFFFLPSILLSGFMFPFRGMPDWAQTLGQLLPLTHFLRIVRGILLKGNGWAEVAAEVGALLAFTSVMLTVAVVRYRRTLD